MTPRCLSFCTLLALGCSASNEPGPVPGKSQPGGGPAGAPEGAGPGQEAGGTEEGAAQPEPEAEPEPEPEPEPDPSWEMPAYPLSLAEGRLQIYDLYLYPTNSYMWDAMADVFEAWEVCMTEHLDGCGYQVFEVASDRHRLGYSKSWYYDRLDGPLEACLARGSERFRGSQETPVDHLYVVAIGVASSAEEMAGCTEGIEAPTQLYLRERRDAH